VQVSEFGIARQPNTTQILRCLHGVARFYADAALLQMAIDRLEPVRLGDNHCIPAFAPFDLIEPDCPHRYIFHAVSPAQHSAIGSCTHRDAFAFLNHTRQPEISAVVPVICFMAAHVIAVAGDES
jgi:hypothetical protein